MSITENAAIKAVRDGLEGRNVPIVHEEIRVVLAMALERDALRARVAELERERDAAKADAARLREALERYGDHHPCCDYAERALYEDCACGFRDALASAPSAEPTPRDIEADVCTALRAAGFSTSVLTPSGKVEVVSERIERIAAVVAKVVKP